MIKEVSYVSSYIGNIKDSMACIAPPAIPVLRQERPAAVPEARRPGLSIQERRSLSE
jgi:hypothetical protein